MHQALTDSFYKLVDRLQKDSRCKGGWHYGSISRGLSDNYSDYDPVWLVGDSDFEDFAGDVEEILQSCCDELVVHWPEDYNGPHLKNYCNVIRAGGTLHQLDFFILNADHPEEWWCRQHLKGCTRDHLIFDRTGEVAALLDRGLSTDNASYDLPRLSSTYWMHAQMMVKYVKRKNWFKLAHLRDFLYQAHGNLLLSHYDSIDWGGLEDKLHRCLPEDRKAELIAYHSVPIQEFGAIAIESMKKFNTTAAAFFQNKGLDYPFSTGTDIITFAEKELDL